MIEVEATVQKTEQRSEMGFKGDLHDITLRLPCGDTITIPIRDRDQVARLVRAGKVRVTVAEIESN